MSVIIDALKRAQKARLERDKKERAKSILFPSGDSRKRVPSVSKRNVISAILLLLLVGALFVLAVPFKKEEFEREKKKVSMPIEPPTNKNQGKILPRVESIRPPLIILPPVETEKQEDMGTGKSPRKGKDLKTKSNAKSWEKLPEGISGPVKKLKRYRELARSLPAGTKEGRKTKLKPESSPPKSSSATMESAVSHFNLGVSYQEEGKLRKAIEEYEKVISIEPFNVDAYNNLGMAYKDLGELERAIHYYRKAITLNPQYERAHCNLAIALYLKGDLKAAVSEAKLAIALNPKDIENYNNLGLFYKESNRPHEAMEAFLKVLALDPSYAPAHYNLALLFEKQGKTEKAISHYQKFIKLSRSRDNWGLVEKVARHVNLLQASGLANQVNVESQ